MSLRKNPATRVMEVKQDVEDGLKLFRIFNFVDPWADLNAFVAPDRPKL